MQVDSIPQITDSWLPVYVGIVTASAAILGVVVTSVVNFLTKRFELKHGVREANRTLVIGRLEELHEKVTNLIWESNRLYNLAVDCRTLPANEKPKVGDGFDRLRKASPRISSLLLVHAPELKDEWVSLRQDIWAYVDEAEKLSNGGSDMKRAGSLRDDAVESIRALEAKIRKKLQDKLATK